MEDATAHGVVLLGWLGSGSLVPRGDVGWVPRRSAGSCCHTGTEEQGSVTEVVDVDEPVGDPFAHAELVVDAFDPSVGYPAHRISAGMMVGRRSQLGLPA